MGLCRVLRRLVRAAGPECTVGRRILDGRKMWPEKDAGENSDRPGGRLLPVVFPF